MRPILPKPGRHVMDHWDSTPAQVSLYQKIDVFRDGRRRRLLVPAIINMPLKVHGMKSNPRIHGKHPGSYGLHPVKDPRTGAIRYHRYIRANVPRKIRRSVFSKFHFFPSDSDEKGEPNNKSTTVTSKVINPTTNPCATEPATCKNVAGNDVKADQQKSRTEGILETAHAQSGSCTVMLMESPDSATSASNLTSNTKDQKSECNIQQSKKKPNQDTSGNNTDKLDGSPGPEMQVNSNQASLGRLLSPNSKPAHPAEGLKDGNSNAAHAEKESRDYHTGNEQEQTSTKENDLGLVILNTFHVTDEAEVDTKVTTMSIADNRGRSCSPIHTVPTGGTFTDMQETINKQEKVQETECPHSFYDMTPIEIKPEESSFFLHEQEEMRNEPMNNYETEASRYRTIQKDSLKMKHGRPQRSNRSQQKINEWIVITDSDDEAPPDGDKKTLSVGLDYDCENSDVTPNEKVNGRTVHKDRRTAHTGTSTVSDHPVLASVLRGDYMQVAFAARAREEMKKWLPGYRQEESWPLQPIDHQRLDDTPDGNTIHRNKQHGVVKPDCKRTNKKKSNKSDNRRRCSKSCSKEKQERKTRPRILSKGKKSQHSSTNKNNDPVKFTPTAEGPTAAFAHASLQRNFCTSKSGAAPMVVAGYTTNGGNTGIVTSAGGHTSIVTSAGGHTDMVTSAMNILEILPSNDTNTIQSNVPMDLSHPLNDTSKSPAHAAEQINSSSSKGNVISKEQVSGITFAPALSPGDVTSATGRPDAACKGYESVERFAPAPSSKQAASASGKAIGVSHHPGSGLIKRGSVGDNVGGNEAKIDNEGISASASTSSIESATGAAWTDTDRMANIRRLLKEQQELLAKVRSRNFSEHL